MKITKEAYELRWINKQDVYDGLNDKLVAARENIKKFLNSTITEM
jgi:hypothetical protein